VPDTARESRDLGSRRPGSGRGGAAVAPGPARPADGAPVLPDEARLRRLLEAFAGVELLVVGDVILDEYLWGSADRVSPEAPVPVVHVEREALALGGAGNVARNVVALGGRCRLCSVVGDDADGRRVAGLLEDLGVDPGGLVFDAGRSTTRKTRVVARSQQVLRYDRETPAALSPAMSRRLLALSLAAAEGVSGAVLEDYGKGVLAPRPARRLLQRLRAAGLWVGVDPKAELAPFRGASLVKPNLREACAMVGHAGPAEHDLERIAARLRRRLGGAELAITLGGGGMAVFGEAGARRVPTASQDVFDMQGAGDTSIAVLALAVCAGADLREAALLANAAAAVVVRKSGTAAADPSEVEALLPAVLRASREAAP